MQPSNPGSRVQAAICAALFLIALPIAALADDAEARTRLKELEDARARIAAERAEIAAREKALDAELDTLRRELGVEAPAPTVAHTPAVPAAADGDESAVPAPTLLAAAAPPPPDGMDDREIVIVAKRFRSKIAQTTQNVSVYDRDDIDRRQSPLLSDVLLETPGVNAVGGGVKGVGGTFVFIRGAASVHTLVLLNGIPLNNSGGVSAFDFDGWNTTGVERVEILRGSYGLLYGSEAIGGVVWIESKKGRGAPHATVTLEGGSFGTHRESVDLGGGGEYGDFSLSVTNYGTQNDLSRSAIDEREVLGRFGLNAGRDLYFDTTVYFQDYDAETPFDYDTYAPGGPMPRDPNEDLTGSITAIGTEATWKANGWITARLHGSILNLDGTDDDGPAGPITFDPDETPDSGDEYEGFLDEYYSTLRTREWRARGMVTMFLNDAFGWATVDDGGIDVEVTAGAEYVDQFSRVTTITPVYSNLTRPLTNTNQRRGSANVKSWFLLVDAALPDTGVFSQSVVNGGVRVDDTSTFGSESSPYFGARTLIAPTDTLLRSSYGEGFAAPKPGHLSGLFGNPDLTAEVSETFEVGAQQRFFDGDLVVGATWFDMTIDDAINFDPTPQPGYPNGRLVNTGGTDHQGWEYEVRGDLGSGFEIRGTATAQNVRERLSGETIRYKRFGSAGISWRNADWLLSLDGFFSGELQNPGTPASAPDGHLRKSAGKRKIINLTARYEATERLTIFGRIENLTDYDYYSRPVYADKGLGIGFYLGAELRF